MSKTKNNVITKTYSGKLGDQVVFRNRYGLSIMAITPRKKKRVPTPAQLAHQQLFFKATRYAKAILADPIRKAKYAIKAFNGRTVYTLGISDYLKPPVVNEIDVTNYSGKIGDKIVVDASDGFEVTGVRLKITGTDSVVIEEGDCVLDPINFNWVYTATVEKTAIPGVTVKATAVDNPGHSGQKMITLV